MKMKNAGAPIFKRLLKIMLTVLVIAGMSAAFISGQTFRKNMVCTGLEASVTDSLSSRFIKAGEVAGLIRREYGEFMDIPCQETDLAAIEALIDSQDAVRKSQVFFKRNGLLNVVIDQREPVLRFQMGRNGFYADNEGVLFPLQSQYTAHVIVIDGKMPISWEDYRKKEFNPRQQRWLQGVVELANTLREDFVWNEKISQIHCSPTYGMLLIPKEGQERFIIGEPEKIPEKLAKMGKYYTHIKPVKDKKYTRIDLRYDGQIICK